jgi:hypothetical protein
MLKKYLDTKNAQDAPNQVDLNSFFDKESQIIANLVREVK